MNKESESKEVAKWAETRAKEISFLAGGLNPNVIDLIAATLRLAWQNGYGAGLDAASVAVTKAFEKHEPANQKESKP